jgi:hypothetical protein
MQGIFTLGEDSTRAAAEIERLTREITGLDNDLIRLPDLVGEDGNGGREAELAAARAALIEACWKSQVDHKDVHERLHRLPWQEKRLLREGAGRGGGQHFGLQTLDSLTAQATTVFQDAATLEIAIAPISFDRFAGLEASRS